MILSTHSATDERSTYRSHPPRLGRRTLDPDCCSTPHAPVHAVAEALVHVDRGEVDAAHVEIDEVAVVVIVRHLLEPGHELARESEPTVFGGDCERGYMPVELGAAAFCLADDYRIERNGWVRDRAWGSGVERGLGGQDVP